MTASVIDLLSQPWVAARLSVATSAAAMTQLAAGRPVGRWEGDRLVIVEPTRQDAPLHPEDLSQTEGVRQ